MYIVLMMVKYLEPILTSKGFHSRLPFMIIYKWNYESMLIVWKWFTVNHFWNFVLLDNRNVASIVVNCLYHLYVVNNRLMGRYFFIFEFIIFELVLRFLITLAFFLPVSIGLAKISNHPSRTHPSIFKIF